MSQPVHAATNVPFAGHTKPSISDIARIVKSSSVTRWSPPGLVAPEVARGKSVFWLAVALVLPLGLAALGGFYSLRESSGSLLAANPPQKSIYVVAHSLSHNFVTYLVREQAEGKKILVVSDRPLALPAGLSFHRIAPDQCQNEGLLVDQTRWYPLR
jgi:hypothetical protein